MMIQSVRYRAADAFDIVAITLSDGSVWMDDATLPADTGLRGDLARWLAAGNVIAPYVPPPATAPASVLRHQGLLALLGVGITEAMVSDAIAEITNMVERETARIRFMSPSWTRESTFIDFGKQAFGLTDAQVDALFVAAAAL